MVDYLTGVGFNLILRILVLDYHLLVLRGPPQTPRQNQVKPPPKPEGTCLDLPLEKRIRLQPHLNPLLGLILTDLSQFGLTLVSEHHFAPKKPPHHHSWVKQSFLRPAPPNLLLHRCADPFKQSALTVRDLKHHSKHFCDSLDHFRAGNCSKRRLCCGKACDPTLTCFARFIVC